MILSQLHDITVIDSEIVELHEKLQALYKQRADLTIIKGSRTESTLSTIADSINLSSIDLSLQ